jgi:hypothetical protein
MKLFFTEDDHTLGLVEGEPAISITEANAKVEPLVTENRSLQARLTLLETKLAAAEEALSFYADKLNWDSEEIIPTCWDEGSIDLGRRASAYFLSYPKEPGDKP